jgi:hydroxymethylbilane synthase
MSSSKSGHLEPRVLKLGTRKSLLAWAQSSWVARKVEAHHPHVKVELVGIETQGDKILDKPLSQIEGKEFFTAELDHQLMDGRVDFTVHSMKDLSLDRPSAFTLAATPPRELPHDVIVFHESVISRLQNGEEVRIGTSSPRRLTLIPSFLKDALPRFNGSAPQVRFVEIRGNVNTRLSRVHEKEGTEKKLDGVVLAFAGLERLAYGDAAAQELWRLLENTRLMIPPLKECPTAPAQGALAIETRTNHPEVIALLKDLHDPHTLASVQKEREILQEWGGGCHQKLGATYTGSQLFIRGVKPNGDCVEEVRDSLHTNEKDLKDYLKVEPSDLFTFKEKAPSVSEQKILNDSKFIFIAHSRAYEFLPATNFSQKRIWVSGTKSWFKLAGKGVWVEGSVENRGFKALQKFASKKLLRMQENEFAVLTHAESDITDAAHRITTYGHQFKSVPDSILKAPKLYWTSSLPFQTIWNSLNESDRAEFKKKHHASGPGRTLEALKAQGIEPKVVE